MKKPTRSDSEPMIELIKVNKHYPPDIAALSDISFTINNGEMCFLIGKSGAGKTTLLKLLCNMEKPTRGLIEVAGQELNQLRGRKLSRLRQKIGVAYQDFKLLTERTTAENIAVAMEVSYKKPQFIKDRVRSLLDQLGLIDKHDTLTGELSRGEQQRVALARAIANSPTIILVDEPTGNLDAATTERVMRLLSNCNKSGATILVATHDESIFRSSVHRVLEIAHGRLANDNLPGNVMLNSLAYGGGAVKTVEPPAPRPAAARKTGHPPVRRRPQQPARKPVQRQPQPRPPRPAMAAPHPAAPPPKRPPKSMPPSPQGAPPSRRRKIDPALQAVDDAAMSLQELLGSEEFSLDSTPAPPEGRRPNERRKR